MLGYPLRPVRPDVQVLDRYAFGYSFPSPGLPSCAWAVLETEESHLHSRSRVMLFRSYFAQGLGVKRTCRRLAHPAHPAHPARATDEAG
jgi:hypothetical protein